MQPLSTHSEIELARQRQEVYAMRDARYRENLWLALKLILGALFLLSLLV